MNDFLTNIANIFEQSILGITFGNLILSVLIMMLALIFRKLFTNIIVSLLTKITKKTKATWDDELVDACIPPIRLIILSTGIYFAARALNFDDKFFNFFNSLVRSLFIYAIIWALFRSANILSKSVKIIIRTTDNKVDDFIFPFIEKAVKVIIVIIGITAIAKEWSYDIETLIAGLGIGGLALALAAQDTISNMFGGFTVILDKSFKMGDWIEVADTKGIVEHIGFRTTRIRTFSKSLVSVPNSSIASGVITNYTKVGGRRVYFHLGVTYSTSIKLIKQCKEEIENLLKNHKEVHNNDISVKLDNFGASSLDILVLFYTIPLEFDEYINIKDDINLKILEICEDLKVDIAFPSTSVYIEKIEK